MKLLLKDFGRFGVVHDTMNSALPVGVWSNARNIRFSGMEMEKMLEPTIAIPFDNDVYGEAMWMQGWSDGLATYIAVATPDRLWYYLQGGDGESGSWSDATRSKGGTYNTDGVWDSFIWGDTVIFNNGADVPQIFNSSSSRFENLPNWGLISTVDDILADGPPTKDVNAFCRVLRPYKNFLIACGVSEQGTYQSNTVWWSDATSLPTFSTTVTGGGPPLWDYESPATLSAKSAVGIGDGKIVAAEMLNENLIIYNDRSATAMQFTGGSLVMGFRRILAKGAAGLHTVAEFNNQHYVLSRDQIYVHDGSSVKLIAKDRVEEEFFTRAGKSGRFGGPGDVDWDTIQVVKNPDRKEIYTLFGVGGRGQAETCTEFPNAGLTLEPTIIWDQTSGATVNTQGPQGLFGVSGKKIIAGVDGHYAAYTNDLGETWTEYEDELPDSDISKSTNKYLYNPNNGLWYLSREAGAGTSSGRYWSDDNGLTWNMIFRNDLQQSSTNLDIDFTTNRVFSGGDGSTPSPQWGITDPMHTTGTPDWFNNITSSHEDSMAIINGYYCMSSWLDNGQWLRLIPITDETTFETTPPTDRYGDGQLGQSGVNDFAPWSKAFNNEYVLSYNFVQATTFVSQDRRIGKWHIIDPLAAIALGPGIALPEVKVDFEEAIDMHRCNCNDDYWVFIARPKNADYTGDKRLLLRWCTDPRATTPDWSPVITVNMPYIPKEESIGVSRFHIEWAEDNKWVVGYREDTTNHTKLFVIDLCVEE